MSSLLTLSIQFLDAAKRGDVVKMRTCYEESNEVINLKDDRGRPSLFLAAENGHLEAVQYLVQNGVDMEATGGLNNWTALFVAVKKNHLEVVRYLVEQGAAKHTMDGSGRTLLMLAAQKGYAALVAYLLQQGLDKEKSAIDNSDSPLYAAAALGHLEVVQRLVQGGANKEFRSSRGETPLHIAAAQSNLEVVLIWCNKGPKRILSILLVGVHCMLLRLRVTWR